MRWGLQFARTRIEKLAVALFTCRSNPRYTSIVGRSTADPAIISGLLDRVLLRDVAWKGASPQILLIPLLLLDRSRSFYRTMDDYVLWNPFSPPSHRTEIDTYMCVYILYARVSAGKYR